jgi:hypothetical protein
VCFGATYHDIDLVPCAASMALSCLHTCDSVGADNTRASRQLKALGRMQASQAGAGTSTTAVSRCLLCRTRQHRYEIRRRRFILLSDLRKGPTFALDSYNWSTVGT